MPAPDPAALERLDRIQADPHLRHTAARWRAHLAAYPDSGAEHFIVEYEAGDRLKAQMVEEMLAELRADPPDSLTDDIGYLEWVLSELRPES